VVSAGLGFRIPRLFETESSFTEFRDALTLIKQHGFLGVELNLGTANQGALRRIHGEVRQQRLRIAAVGTGQVFVANGLSLTDSATRERAVATVKGLTRFASDEEAVLIIGMVRGGVSPEGDRMKLLRQSLVECDEAAAELEVRIALEPINRYETSLLNTAAEVDTLIREEKLAATGVLLDTFHMNIEEQSIERTIRAHHARITHFHIADSNRWPPGNGHLRLGQLLKLLEDLGYDRWVSTESLPKPDSTRAVEETAHFLTTNRFL